MPSITPSLWFDHNLEEAATFYTSVFPNSHIEDFNHATGAGPGEAGSILSGSFVLDGTRFIGTNVQKRYVGQSLSVMEFIVPTRYSIETIAVQGYSRRCR